jgi:flagellar operon protein
MQINNKIISTQPPILPQGAAQGQNTQNVAEGDFRRIMDLEFSKHASLRLNDRGLQLNGDQMSRLEKGVAKAQNKGIRDSLVLIDNIALVVNIKNRVVITALNQQEQVFTNIDGAVIV